MCLLPNLCPQSTILVYCTIVRLKDRGNAGVNMRRPAVGSPTRKGHFGVGMVGVSGLFCLPAILRWNQVRRSLGRRRSRDSLVWQGTGTALYSTVYPDTACFTKIVEFRAMQDPARTFCLRASIIGTVALHDLAWHQQSTEGDLATAPEALVVAHAHLETGLARGSSTHARLIFPPQHANVHKI